MQLVVNLDDEKFKDIVDKEIHDLPKEKIQEILLEGLRSYVSTDTDSSNRVIRSIFEEKDHNGYFNTNKPTKYFESIVSNWDHHSEKVNELMDAMIDTLIKENKSLLVEVFTNLIAHSLANKMQTNNSFKDAINDISNTISKQIEQIVEEIPILT